jgi:hypothetical protein
VAERYQIADLFEAFVPKPDVYIDDNLGTVMNAFKFDPVDLGGWEQTARFIVRSHVDPPHRPRDDRGPGHRPW